MDLLFIYDFISFLVGSIILILIFIAITTKVFIEKLIYSEALVERWAYDRLVFKAVPDFIDLHYNNFHWFIFNIADIFITLGIIVFIMRGLFEKN